MGTIYILLQYVSIAVIYLKKDSGLFLEKRSSFRAAASRLWEDVRWEKHILPQNAAAFLDLLDPRILSRALIGRFR